MENFSINSLIKHISSYDSVGKKNKIDTLLEYNLLGEYLNGSYIESAPNYSDLKEEDKISVKNLFDKIQSKLQNIISKNQEIKITDENAKKYSEMINKLRQDTCNDTSKNNDKEKLKIKLENALYKYCIDNNYELDDLKPEECNYNFIIKNLLENKKTIEKHKELSTKSLEIIEHPYNNKKLKKAIKKYLKNNNIQTAKNIQTNEDLGNGKFDKTATQTSDTCWGHAGINTLLSTTKGKELLETNMYFDKETGVYAIHLQEAEDNGINDGIFIITPEEIAQEGKQYTKGEGDVAAYLIAIEKYFQEIQKNPELTEKMENDHKSVRDIDQGNYNFRFFELITGGQSIQYGEFEDYAINNGIGNGNPFSKVTYDEIYSIAKNKNGGSVLAYNEHSISVIGTRNGNLIVQESNNNSEMMNSQKQYKKNNHIFKQIDDINGKPAYELTKENFEMYIRASSYIKW